MFCSTTAAAPRAQPTCRPAATKGARARRGTACRLQVATALAARAAREREREANAVKTAEHVLVAAPAAASRQVAPAHAVVVAAASRQVAPAHAVVVAAASRQVAPAHAVREGQDAHCRPAERGLHCQAADRPDKRCRLPLSGEHAQSSSTKMCCTL